MFAKKRILKDKEFNCDVVVVEADVNTYIELKQYSFPFSGKKWCICMGFASFLNHSITPNLKISKIDRDKLIKNFIVLRNIEVGEELTLFYNKKFDS